MSAPRYRPNLRADLPRPAGAHCLAGTPLWFADATLLEPGAAPRTVPAGAIPDAMLNALTAPRAPVAGLDLSRPRIMGIVNVTPDSFSDGGRHLARDAAVAHAETLLAEGADILDIGGESTRPGADPVPDDVEIDRVVPVIAALRARGVTAPISVDTRKAAVARAALAAGAGLFNDVSALTHDPASLDVAAGAGCAVCLMHAQGDPRTMQDAPSYGDVVLEVADYLEDRVRAAGAAGIPRARILVDPGIGFGKTAGHNLALIRNLAVLHGLGCGILFGASRKRFIGAVGGGQGTDARLPGSLAVALEALRHGAQVLRVHDVAATRQAVALWQALNFGEDRDD